MKSKLLLVLLYIFCFITKGQDNPQKDSSQIKPLKGIYVSPNQYNITNSGFMLKKKSIELQNIMGLYNNIEFGISNNISLSTGILINPSFSELPLIFGVKFGKTVSEDVNVFIFSKNLAFFGRSSDFQGLTGTGITLGNLERNLSFGVNLAYNERFVYKRPLFSFAGSFKVKRRIYIIGDNLLDRVNSVYSFGVRINANRKSFSFGYIISTAGENYPLVKAQFCLTKVE
jgi:hypothetical protein